MNYIIDDIDAVFEKIYSESTLTTLFAPKNAIFSRHNVHISSEHGEYVGSISMFN